MATERTLLVVAGLLAVAFVPVLVHLAVVRNLERHHREPWSQILKAFAWGATGAVAIALLAEVAVAAALALSAFLLTVVVAPLAEEAAKGLGLRWVRDRHIEPEDGAIYGAAVGLGFAGTENLFYGIQALVETGPEGYAVTSLVRALVSALVHASASAVLGAALWKVRAGAGAGVGVTGYALAVALHAGFNLLVGLGLLAGSLVAVAATWAVSGWTIAKIRRHDRVAEGVTIR